MLIDFHTHSTASDGALTPAQLVKRAAEQGVQMLAITDHDTVEGYLAVRDDADLAASPMQLVAGVELSCRWSGATIHVVGLGIDCEAPVMQQAIAAMDIARRERAEVIGQRLAKAGYPGALEGAQQLAGQSQLGRPHFASWMVDQGHAEDHNKAFDRYLGQGKMGDVKAYWPELQEVVGWITAAGGIAVLAHPYKYKFTGMKLRRLIIDFNAAGGTGIEVHSGRQTRDQFVQLQRYAREFQLVVSMGSDFHRDGPYAPELGVEVERDNGLLGVWDVLADARSVGA